MITLYHKNYNIDLGLLNRLHPFDGKKYEKIAHEILQTESVELRQPLAPVSQQQIEDFADSLLPLLLQKKRYVLRALEVPYIPLLPFYIIDRRILLPMRWAVAGTIEAARLALEGTIVWNLSGGYHHASRASAEGFCIYNDIGITVGEMRKEKRIDDTTRILVVDVDAHHGNGNAYTFMDNDNITLLDIYNNEIYPANDYTKARVDIDVPLAHGTGGDVYLEELNRSLGQIDGDHKLAFVVAGTDVIASDPLGGLTLTVDECTTRDAMVLDRLAALSIPTVVVGGGGYSMDSARAVATSITTYAAAAPELGTALSN